MRFKLFLERIDRLTARQVVLDAVDAGNLSDEQKQNVLGAKIGQLPKLLDRLKKYSVLHPYIDSIEQYIVSHPNANLVALIGFIEGVDDNEPRFHSSDAVHV